MVLLQWGLVHVSTLILLEFGVFGILFGIMGILQILKREFLLWDWASSFFKVPGDGIVTDIHTLTLWMWTFTRIWLCLLFVDCPMSFIIHVFWLFIHLKFNFEEFWVRNLKIVTIKQVEDSIGKQVQISQGFDALGPYSILLHGLLSHQDLTYQPNQKIRQIVMQMKEKAAIGKTIKFYQLYYGSTNVPSKPLQELYDVFDPFPLSISWLFLSVVFTYRLEALGILGPLICLGRSMYSIHKHLIVVAAHAGVLFTTDVMFNAEWELNTKNLTHRKYGPIRNGLFHNGQV